jgi:hypothetical protein
MFEIVTAVDFRQGNVQISIAAGDACIRAGFSSGWIRTIGTV